MELNIKSSDVQHGVESAIHKLIVQGVEYEHVQELLSQRFESHGILIAGRKHYKPHYAIHDPFGRLIETYDTYSDVLNAAFDLLMSPEQIKP